jgi:two-component system, OmpR family, phosphate regulon sensor histidine kinase PhoR
MLIKVNGFRNLAVNRLLLHCMTKRRLYLSVVLMLLAIIAVATFQIYWLVNNFREEKDDLTFRTNVLFRDAIQSIQAEKLQFDSNVHFRVAGAVGTVNAIKRKLKDSMRTGPEAGAARAARHVFITDNKRVQLFKQRLPHPDSLREVSIIKNGNGPAIVKMMSALDSLNDSVSVEELSAKYAQFLKQERIALPFFISRRPGIVQDEWMPPDFENGNEVTLGFKKPVTYRVDVENTTGFVLRKMTSQIIVSVLLVGLTVFSFVLLLRSLVQQRKLTRIKNDFISNITHELKTPIATVSVAIEALRNFDALQDPQRTKEYLAISHNELQRLSFLVDKVLKLSMFEKQQIELKEEQVNLSQLVNEVVTSMKLQFEKYKAQVSVQLHGKDFTIHADRLHITSVLFNLLDNALKYSKGVPSIRVELKEHENEVELNVTDNGIGIAAEYRKKIFDKFFRVPADNTHNVKGYGLGLSYVAYVVQRHYGSIEVESQPGIGSRFIVKLPSTA